MESPKKKKMFMSHGMRQKTCSVCEMANPTAVSKCKACGTPFPKSEKALRRPAGKTNITTQRNIIHGRLLGIQEQHGYHSITLYAKKSGRSVYLDFYSTPGFATDFFGVKGDLTTCGSSIMTLLEERLRKGNDENAYKQAESSSSNRERNDDDDNNNDVEMSEMEEDQQSATVPDFQQPSTTPDSQQPSTVPDFQQSSTVPDFHQPSTTPYSRKPATVPDFQQPSTVPDFHQPSTTPDSRKPATVPDLQQPSTVNLSFVAKEALSPGVFVPVYNEDEPYWIMRIDSCTKYKIKGTWLSHIGHNKYTLDEMDSTNYKCLIRNDANLFLTFNMYLSEGVFNVPGEIHNAILKYKR